MQNQGLRSKIRLPGSKRHEWEAFLGLIPALAVSRVPAGLADRCRHTVGRWHMDSISRENLQVESAPESEGDLDLALARLVQEGLLAPIADEPFRFQVLVIGKPVERESVYAGDDAEALKAATIQEQTGRYQEMRTLQTLLDGGRVAGRREERFRKDLAALGAVYEAQWVELECAVGREEAEEVRHAVEEFAADKEYQLRLPFAIQPTRGLQEDSHAES